MTRRGKGYRLEGGSGIDRTRPLRFQFEGGAMTGFAGDTLASALLANGVDIVGRSFKYHRPRGIFAAGYEDPGAMLDVHDAFGHDPAIRAGQVRLAEGLQVRTVTGWPSARFDVGALAQLAAPLLKAGFYYKTMMWPGWRVYEPLLRRVTGFGRPEAGAHQRQRQPRHDSCDVLVIGGGAAGIAAARGLGGCGLRVVVADMGAALGGSTLWQRQAIEGTSAPAWAAAQGAALLAAGVEVLTDTLVAGAYENNVFTLIEAHHRTGGGDEAGGVAAERLWKLRARHVVLSCGAVERPLVFAGNDRPGIMLASALETFIGQYGVAPAGRVAVFTNNDGGYDAALAAHFAGLMVTAVVDSRTTVDPALCQCVLDAGIRHLRGSEIIETSGYRRLAAIHVAPTDGGERTVVECGALAVAGGWSPAIHLAAHRGARPVYDDGRGAFVCPTLPEGWYAAGAVTGERGLPCALEQGQAAAETIRAAEGLGAGARAALPVPTKGGADSIVPFWRASQGRPERMWVDLQNDVTISDIELAVNEGYGALEHLKRYTTLGMGTDQGRTSNVNGIGILAGIEGRTPDQVGTTTFRPPVAAVRMATIAGNRQGQLYRPMRRLPAHSAHESLEATFEDFGWLRPDWYASNGETRETAVAAEMAAVREAVGLFDGSALGKIEVTGPDAASFLNRFYVSNLLSLRPGRVRYSVMLREDGVIFDDGVVSCVTDRHFIAGPSSAHAERVANWFERWRQTEWPDLAVAISNVTANWAALAISGPRARALLACLETDIDLSAAAFPHMAFRQGQIAGMTARVQRVSFTGEQQFEISVPARHGQTLFELLLAAGRNFGIRPVGLEAWLRLRLEKGYLHIGSDTNGRTTPDDIGLGPVVARKAEDFIGKRSLTLPFNLDPRREQLVGLLARGGTLRPGGRILAPGARRRPCRTEGYVTSAAYSPALQGSIGLALVEGGRSRHGEVVRIADDGVIVEAEIGAPHFYDPDNSRLAT